MFPLFLGIVVASTLLHWFVRGRALQQYHAALKELAQEPSNPDKLALARATGTAYGRVNGMVFTPEALEYDIQSALQGAARFYPGQYGVPVAERVPECDVWLLSGGPAKLNVIKIVRTRTGFGLKDAKDLVDAAPGIVVHGVTERYGKVVASELTASGATAEVRLC